MEKRKKERNTLFILPWNFSVAIALLTDVTCKGSFTKKMKMITRKKSFKYNFHLRGWGQLLGQKSLFLMPDKSFFLKHIDAIFNISYRYCSSVSTYTVLLLDQIQEV